MRLRIGLGVASAVISALVVAACSPSPASQPDAPDAHACATLAATCSPQYDPPTFDTIYAKILSPTCASGKGTCHTADAKMGGLEFVSADESYALLLGKNGAPAHVIPKDAACSEITERLTASDPNYHMPPGPNSVSAGELCTIALWINGGAAR